MTEPVPSKKTAGPKAERTQEITKQSVSEIQSIAKTNVDGVGAAQPLRKKANHTRGGRQSKR